MAKLKKAPGRLIGRRKQEAIAANPAASDAQLADIINETARGQGYDYTITPGKVRTGRAKKPARKPAPAPAARAHSAKEAASGGISLEDVKAVKGLVDKLGADKGEQLARVLSE
jgi:hypothetical protein